MTAVDYPCPKCLAEPGVQCAGGWSHSVRYAVWSLCELRDVSLTDRQTWWSQVDDAIKERKGDHE